MVSANEEYIEFLKGLSLPCQELFGKYFLYPTVYPSLNSLYLSWHVFSLFNLGDNEHYVSVKLGTIVSVKIMISLK